MNPGPEIARPSEHALVPVPPPLVFVGFLIGALTLHFLVPISTPWPAAARIIGIASVVSGLMLGGWAVRSMLRAHTSPDPHEPTTALVTSGPYRWSRNPIYLGFALMFLGFTLLAGTLWGLILLPVLLLMVTRIIVRAEETYLVDRFWTTYRDYRSRVRRWI